MENYFPFPDDPAAQKKWGDETDIKFMDAEYHKQRSLAVRRVLFIGVLRAFEEIPEMEHLHFRFGYDKKSLKDSMTALSGTGDAAADKKVNDRFHRFMGPYRSRVGQDTTTFDRMMLFFHGQAREMTRANHEVFTAHILDAKTERWTDEAQARWEAEILDNAAPEANGKRSGPRL